MAPSLATSCDGCIILQHQYHAQEGLLWHFFKFKTEFVTDMSYSCIISINKRFFFVYVFGINLLYHIHGGCIILQRTL